MNFLIQADTTLETLDPSINCSPSVIATITVIQNLLVKPQVQQLMSGSLRAKPLRQVTNRNKAALLILSYACYS